MDGVTLFPVGDPPAPLLPLPLAVAPGRWETQWPNEGRSVKKSGGATREILFPSVKKRKSGSVDPADGSKQHN